MCVSGCVCVRVGVPGVLLTPGAFALLQTSGKRSAEVAHIKEQLQRSVLGHEEGHVLQRKTRGWRKKKKEKKRRKIGREK